MGSTHTYDLGKRTGKGGRDTAVELALNPEEIDMMDSETMAIRAEAALREQQSQLAKEDLSDMVAEHAAKQKNKRKRQEAKEDLSDMVAEHAAKQKNKRKTSPTWWPNTQP